MARSFGVRGDRSQSRSRRGVEGSALAVATTPRTKACKTLCPLTNSRDRATIGLRVEEHQSRNRASMKRDVPKRRTSLGQKRFGGPWAQSVDRAIAGLFARAKRNE